METEEVTVVVYSGRGLQVKKPGRHKFSVLFGVGSKKFRTSAVKEPTGNPDWNEETVIRISNVSDHVFFTVTERDDILGQLIIPVASLMTVKGVVKKCPLKSHKKCLNPQGELLYQCYISKQRPSMLTTGSNTITTGGGQLTGFQRLRHSLNPTQNFVQKKEEDDKTISSSLSSFNKKLSKSLHDIFHIGRFGDSKYENEQQQQSNKGKRFSLRFPSLISGIDKVGKEVPIVTHIVPNMATIQGGTRLALEGLNLGVGKSDIMELILCGSDLLDSIEFESESRIYVTTQPTAAGKGDLWIETISGGQNVIKNIFTFVDRTSTSNNVQDSKTYSSRRHSSVGDNLGKTATISENNSSMTEKQDNINQLINVVEKSSSLKKDEKQRRKFSAAGSATLPAMFNSDQLATCNTSDTASTIWTDHINLNKHARRASESVVISNKEVEQRKSSDKAELQAEIFRLHKENLALKQVNADMKTYIDGLVARVMLRCPEALAAGDDLKPLKTRSL